ncbi:MAG: transcription elongation factor GreA [Clostridia bacterium]|nr:transcription elongation factor GreA [Clostridia bacterium]
MAKMTAETKKKFQEELLYLKDEGKKEIVRKIQEARAFGDLSENYEYKVAKEDETKHEARIAEVETILANSEIYEPVKGGDTVVLGSTVTIEDVDTGKKSEYEMVGIYESDPNATPKKISDESPLGRVLLGAQLDDEVDFTRNGKTITYCIVKIK